MGVTRETTEEHRAKKALHQLNNEPFYTTKRGKGLTGLGLHIVYNCVAQSLKGTITCTSEVAKGTEFEIKFPVQPAKNKIGTDHWK